MVEKIVYDGKDAVFGRMASVVAKDLLKGNTVSVINCEEVIISGNKSVFVEKVLAKIRMGQGSSLKGPKYCRQEDRLLKRMIRGMLPWDRAKGREAFKRLRCYKGSGELSEEELKKAKTFKHDKPMKYSTVSEIVRLLR